MNLPPPLTNLRRTMKFLVHKLMIDVLVQWTMLLRKGLVPMMDHGMLPFQLMELGKNRDNFFEWSGAQFF